MKYLVLIFIVFSSLSHGGDRDMIDRKWLELKSRNFQLITDLNKEKSKVLIENLEDFRQYLQLASGIEYEEYSIPVRVYAFSNEDTFQQFSSGRYESGSIWATEYGGFLVVDLSSYDFSGGLSDTNKKVQHQIFHYLYLTSINYFDAPEWYLEGMAQFFSSIVILDGRMVFKEMNDIYFPLPLKGNEKLSIEVMLKSKGDFHLKAEAALRSTAENFVRYSLSSTKGSERFFEFVKGLRSGRGVDDAWERAYPVSYTKMGKKIAKHIVGNRFSYEVEFNIPPISRDYGIESRDLNSNDIGFFLGYMELAVAQVGFESRISQLVKINGSDLNSKLLFAEIAIHQGELMTASKLLAECVDLKKGLTSEYYGVIARLNLAQSAVSESKVELLKQSRSNFRKSIQLDPFNIKSYIGMGNLYISWLEHDKAVKVREGQVSLEQAIYFQKTRREIKRASRLYKASDEGDKRPIPKRVMKVLPLQVSGDIFI